MDDVSNLGRGEPEEAGTIRAFVTRFRERAWRQDGDPLSGLGFADRDGRPRQDVPIAEFESRAERVKRKAAATRAICVRLTLGEYGRLIEVCEEFADDRGRPRSLNQVARMAVAYGLAEIRRRIAADDANA